MAEKISNVNSDDTSSSIGTSGGMLPVEQSTSIDNTGSATKFMSNAKISTFNQNLLIEFLKYPTVLFEGSISTSTVIGSTIYSSNVSPALLKSTSLTRISNFATNFRQWNGSMMARFIFTKPIFLQTKIICAFIPGATAGEAENLTISDLYGAQYHAVINPDNESELSFSIPFVSGYNWLNMTDSTGLFVVKLFQPLIASQPTGVSNATIPFTITISSCHDSTTSYNDCPLNFRYLVSPTYKNVELSRDLNEILYTSISPQISTVFNNEFAGFIPRNMSKAFIPRSAIFLPKDAFLEWAKIKYYKNNLSYQDDRDFDSAVASLDNSSDKMYPNYIGTFHMPFKNIFLNYTYPTSPGNVPFGSITSNLDIDKYTYVADNQNSVTRILYCSALAPPKLGLFYIKNQSLRLINSGSDHTFIPSATLVITQRPSGLYNYLIETSNASYDLNTGDRIDWTEQINIAYHDPNFNVGNVNAETNSMYNAVIAAQNAAGSHILLTSRQTKSELMASIASGNYMNMTLCNSDMFAASFSKRALETSNLINDGGERFNPVSVFFAIKYGVDFVAKASRIISDVLTVLTPIFTMNGERIGPNSSVIFDLSINSAPLGFVQDTIVNLRNTEDVVNPGIGVINIS